MMRSAMTLLWVLAILGMIGSSIYIYTTSTPREYLEERYTKVERFEYKFWGSLKCNFGKSRQTYDFTAKRLDGKTVTGYVCFTPVDVFGWAGPVVHEESVR